MQGQVPLKVRQWRVEQSSCESSSRKTETPELTLWQSCFEPAQKVWAGSKQDCDGFVKLSSPFHCGEADAYTNEGETSEAKEENVGGRSRLGETA